VLDNVASIIREAARDKGLVVDGRHRFGAHVAARRPDAAAPGLLNFAGNAVKFTEQGRIDMSAELLAKQDDAAAGALRGAGHRHRHPPTKLGRLFNEFEQMDASTTRATAAPGLGLAITRRLAHLMGGDVGVQQQPGVGSTFWFTARLHRGRGLMPGAAAAAPACRTWSPGCRLRDVSARLLLVEDNAINREVALELLHGAGLRWTRPSTAAEAVAWPGSAATTWC
jgi:two-component system sensor histidine kinase/response regulator